MTHSAKALLMAGLLALGGTAATAKAQKIAVVDIQRALLETEDGRKAKARLKKLFEKRQQTLDKQQTDLKSMQENLQKQKSVLSQEVFAKKLQAYQKALQELQVTYMEFQKELAAKEADLTKDILARMQRIGRHIGQKDGYALIVDKGGAGVLYVPTSYDLTDVLIQRYNAGEGKGAAKRSKSKKK